MEWKSFGVMPPKDGYKVKWKCFRCHMWGDEHDLVKHFNPQMSFGRRVTLVAEMEFKYRQMGPSTSTLGEATSPAEGEDRAKGERPRMTGGREVG
jgi:hypothetical protein